MALYAARAAQSHVGLARRLARDEHARIRRHDVVAMAGRIVSVGDAVGAARDIMTIAQEESASASGERDAAEKERLLEILGADPSSRTQPPHIRSQVAALEREQKARATRFTRDVVDRALVDLLSVYRDALVLRTGAGTALVNEDARQVVTRVAEALPAERVLGAMDAVGTARERIDANVAPLLALEAMALDLRLPRLTPRSAPAGADRCRIVTSPARGHAGASLIVRAMTLRAPALLVGAVVAVTALAGCSVVDGLGGQGDARPSAVATPQTPPPGSTGLDRFYGQQLSWTDCSGAECTELTVPVDYAHPDAGTLEISVLRVPAKKPSKRHRLARGQPRRTGWLGRRLRAGGGLHRRSGGARPLRRRRASTRAGSAAPRRSTASPTPGSTSSSGPTRPRTPRPRSAPSPRARPPSPGRARTNAGSLLAHVSTEDAARDMDVLRAALGEEKLTYLGKSYGTYLGSTYADLFPQQVGRFVLDGVVAPDLTSEEINLGQAKGFELATRTWAKYCVSEGGCPLGDSVDTVMERLRTFLADLDARPVPRTGDTSVPALTEGWASLGIAAAMYDQGAWRTLIDALDGALAGDGTALMQLADQYADRNPGGGYAGNIMEVIYAVNCLDKPESDSVPEHEAQAEAATKEAPTWGRYLMWSSLVCGYWPVKPTTTPHTVSAKGAEPIVVIGTTRDPATPYEWSVRLHDQLAKASLISFDGDGHTAYTRSNSCVDDAVDAWYLDGKLPKDGLRC